MFEKIAEENRKICKQITMRRGCYKTSPSCCWLHRQAWIWKGSEVEVHRTSQQVERAKKYFIIWLYEHYTVLPWSSDSYQTEPFQDSWIIHCQWLHFENTLENLQRHLECEFSIWIVSRIYLGVNEAKLSYMAIQQVTDMDKNWK